MSSPAQSNSSSSPVTPCDRVWTPDGRAGSSSGLFRSANIMGFMLVHNTNVDMDEGVVNI